MIRFARVAACAAALLACGRCAEAEPVEATAALTINVLDGHHAVNQGVDARIDFVPLPLAELTVRTGSDALRLEGLPPVAFGYATGGGVGATTTRLSVLNATFRHALARGWFAGAGETLYNQHTTYAAQPGSFYERFGTPATGGRPQFFTIEGSEEQYSRVAGLRVEGGHAWHAGRWTGELSAALNPVLRGLQYTFIPTAIRTASPTFADPERGTQLDLALRFVRPAGRHGRLLGGLRYLHYSARYVDQPGQLADRNVGIAPVIGYGVRL